ncbi:GNAT family protein [Salinibacterium sp. G-O1]|uniref:GNAT family N-acetyltransferase n=1 Tax=Salinibacterium sp. G-O1 TaxID=3046208 RepID=UPI0024BA924C|nr:GNAT family protein [Salinibacterium sp. G-O1]MDJ0334047.1 GNAT family protein [Salinibacterium sp. G-O1]
MTPRRAPHYRAHEFAAISTPRLLLRAMTSGDVDDVHAYMSNPDVCRFLLHEPRSRETVALKIEEWSTMGRLAVPGDDLQLAMEFTTDDPEAGRVIGHTYFKLTSVDDVTAEIGWTLHPGFEGKGYATEAAAAMLAYAFTTLGLNRVYAELDPRNIASVALCGRLGMREEAHFREHMWLKGEWSDTGIHAILRSEWSARQSG